MARWTKQSDLVHVQFTKDDRCVDMFLTLKEIEKGVERFIDPKNENIRPTNCCSCWPVEKPPKCTFWDRIMFKCCECENKGDKNG